MDKFLYTIFASLPDQLTPERFHRATVDRILLLRLQKTTFAITIVTGVGFVFSLWHLYARMIELDFITTTQLVFSTLEFDLDSLVDALRTMASFTPVSALTFSFFNFIVFGFSLSIVRMFKQSTNSNFSQR